MYTIYVGNINYALDEKDVKKIFSEFGTVVSVKLIRDKISGKSKGYGFVAMDKDDEGEAAVKELEGKIIAGRNFKVSKAHIQKHFTLEKQDVVEKE